MVILTHVYANKKYICYLRVTILERPESGVKLKKEIRSAFAEQNVNMIAPPQHKSVAVIGMKEWLSTKKKFMCPKHEFVLVLVLELVTTECWLAKWEVFGKCSITYGGMEGWLSAKKRWVGLMINGCVHWMNWSELWNEVQWLLDESWLSLASDGQGISMGPKMHCYQMEEKLKSEKQEKDMCGS